ncbi:hypothetical protein PMAYCL1PPCAC_26672 [Pristionchus mayeri]|uniref:EGF-like domain-containing protein n=1 Tax=Pristionchus mayeri TaxID=1317129 RepID=A0AAN5D5L7_9BILA|nr:hypothetical protein PMAYCL1PPCAC_26672 [Pristionchus mayeri]
MPSMIFQSTVAVICLLNTISLAQDTTAFPSTATSSSAGDSPRAGIDFIGPLWLPRSFKISCCRGGTPAPENDLLIRNWTQRVSAFAVDDVSDEGCRVFEGTFLLAATALFKLRSFTGYGVQCKCPGDSSTALDKRCRKLPPCQNNGYRSFSLNMRCACPEPFFGDFCEKYCDQGQKLKGIDGRDYCSCVPFYQGEECREMVCLNGGVESGRRCACPPNFLGYHCEIDANRTAALGGSRFQKYSDNPNEFFTRDISGTIFSLIMIVVLVVSMYLLMKHRMQSQGVSRRDERIHSIYGMTRRGDSISSDGLRILPFSALGIDGPPPYASAAHINRFGQPESLPPLPSYDDATKISGAMHNASLTPEMSARVADDQAPSSSASQTAPGCIETERLSDNRRETEPIFERSVASRRSV